MNILNYPKHVAVIPDGNRTWAKFKGYEPFVGHLEGFNKIIELASYIFEKTSIQVFSAWGLSTENLKNRKKVELDYLFKLYKKIGREVFDVLNKNKVNFRIAGNKEKLPKHLVDFLEEKEKKLTFPNSNKYMFLAINYGGQDEILRAMENLCKNKEVPTKENLEKYMDFGQVPPVELVIRTKQEFAKRLSGFMLWWIGYAQLYFTDLFFPEFGTKELEKALEWYEQTCKTQNFGK